MIMFLAFLLAVYFARTHAAEYSDAVEALDHESREVPDKIYTINKI